MRTRKGTSTFYCWLELIEPEVDRFIRAWPENFTLERGVVQDLVMWAVIPETLLAPDDGAGQKNAERITFARRYAHLPDFVPAFLLFVRKQFRRDEGRFRIQRWLLENITARDGFGTQRYSWALTSQEIASCIKEAGNINDDDVRNAESILLRRLARPRASFFLTSAAEAALKGNKALRRFRRTLPPLM